MEIIKTPIEGLLQIRPRLFRDDRGWFQESYNRDAFAKAGLTQTFVQDNHSRSARNTLRGLHFQTSPGQAKLMRCTLGEIWDVAVDMRLDSPTLGRHFAVRLTQDDPLQFFIPVGFAHGFIVLSEWAEVQYKCTNVYNAATEAGVAWNDPDLAVPWPVSGDLPLISERDKKNQSFRNYCANPGKPL